MGRRGQNDGRYFSRSTGGALRGTTGRKEHVRDKTSHDPQAFSSLWGMTPIKFSLHVNVASVTCVRLEEDRVVHSRVPASQRAFHDHDALGLPHLTPPINHVAIASRASQRREGSVKSRAAPMNPRHGRCWPREGATCIIAMATNNPNIFCLRTSGH